MKIENKAIIYNIDAIPNGMTIEEILEIYHATGMIIHNSKSKAKNPHSVDVNNINQEIIFIHGES